MVFSTKSYTFFCGILLLFRQSVSQSPCAYHVFTQRTIFVQGIVVVVVVVVVLVVVVVVVVLVVVAVVVVIVVGVVIVVVVVLITIVVFVVTDWNNTLISGPPFILSTIADGR